MIVNCAPPSSQSVSERGFTMVEMLVAMTVFALLALLLAQAVTLTSQATTATSKHLDAAAQARLVFDRLALDLAGRPNRSDLGMLFTKATGNDSFQFYSQVEGYSGARPLTTVGYRIQQTMTSRYYQLERGAAGTDWGTPWAATNPLIQFLPNSFSAPATSTTASSDPNYDILTGEVFRLEFCYLLNTGSLSTTSTQTSNGTTGTYSDVVALVVSIGVLDNQSRKLLTNTQIQTLSGSLEDCVDGQDPISKWNTDMMSPGFAATIPPLAAKNIRLFQRTFYVQ